MSLASFHPTVRRWFAQRFGEPSEPQRGGWPSILAGRHTLIAAPTGTGKTLAAFLSAVDSLLRQGAELADTTQVVYVSPLKALGNDVQKNLAGPLAELRELDPSLPEVRVLVRSGDTTPTERARMLRHPPHILVTTPESLYILLTSRGGAAMLRNVRTVVVDEIHALAPNRRGTHLTLTLERLVALCGECQRIGLSATQKPLERVARFLCGADRECTIVDGGHLRELDIGVEVPPSPLGAVCSTETWSEIYARMVELIRAHRTTLVFANTRKMTERVAARLTEALGRDVVTSHHGSLSKERRLDAERRLARGELRALVATASLELGIDVGDVDLVIQVGSVARIATFLQRVGRAGHGRGRVPKGRVFPLTIDELVSAAALMHAVRRRDLDRLDVPRAPLDVLAQQVVATCVSQDQDEDVLFALVRRADPYRDLTREDFDATVRLHADGSRLALLHRDGVHGRLRATRRARLPALTAGGTIQAIADYQVLLEPGETRIGSVDEDFAIEASIGDVFQLGNASWRVVRVEPGKVRVADAHGAPPSLPFWFGDAPARSIELSAAIDEVRANGEDEAWLAANTGIPPAAREQIATFLHDGRTALGAMPSRTCLVLERFFDESGGMQLVLHAPLGSRINKALGLALRKRFCRGFGFELQAAANEDAIVFSLGPMHSFPLDEVFGYLHPNTARDVLVQALLPAPMFATRWRWNVNTALVVPRTRAGRPVPTPLLRMRAEDALAAAFPQVLACGETLPPGDLPVPYDHPLVRQAIVDCTTEAMDVDGMLEVLGGIAAGAIRCVAVDTPTPSVFCESILNAAPYAFLDDAPLEERRTQAVQRRRVLDQRTADQAGALDPDAVARVRAEAWPDPHSADELHEALLWMGCVEDDEAEPWRALLAELSADGRVVREGTRWFAAEASRDPLAVLSGRLEALGPIFSDDPRLLELEANGSVLRVLLDGRRAWCNRRLLARIHRYTLERLRREIEPVSASVFLRFLAVWQRASEGSRAEGPRGLRDVIAQLAGLEVPAHAWESKVLPLRVAGFRRDWLDQLTLSGEIAWARLWGRGGTVTVRNTPLCLFPREDLATWLSIAADSGARDDGSAPPPIGLGAAAAELFDILVAGGAMFPADLERRAGLLPSQFELGLAELVARGVVTCDSFAAIRQLVVATSKRQRGTMPFGVGRWAVLDAPRDAVTAEQRADFVLERLLRRYGVVFHKLLLREKIPVGWRELLRAARNAELRGDVRGGRFVGGFSGEQFALPEAIPLLRRVRREDSDARLEVSAADPLNLRGILTPDGRISPLTLQTVAVG